MLIVWGSRRQIKTTNAEGARLLCPNCKVESKFVEKQVVTYFTLYFIPLFPMHRGEKFVECEYCHARLLTTLQGLQDMEVQRQQKEAEEAAAQQAEAERQGAEAEELVRSWQERPEDRALACRMLDTLAGQSRYYRLQELEPEVRARFGSDPEVLLRLGHSAYALKRYEEAIRDYEQVLAENPYRGDARYYLAASYWAMQPANWDKALEHMRIARDMGYQPAVEALPKLERERNQAPFGS